MSETCKLQLEDKLRIVREHIEQSTPAIPITKLAHRLWRPCL